MLDLEPAVVSEEFLRRVFEAWEVLRPVVGNDVLEDAVGDEGSVGVAGWGRGGARWEGINVDIRGRHLRVLVGVL